MARRLLASPQCQRILNDANTRHEYLAKTIAAAQVRFAARCLSKIDTDSDYSMLTPLLKESKTLERVVNEFREMTRAQNVL
jgi:hypothetical protein